jgi:hypothetical protein
LTEGHPFFNYILDEPTTGQSTINLEHFTFLPNEMQQVGNKSGETRLGFAVLFKFFQYEARFPSHKFEVPKAVIRKASYPTEKWYDMMTPEDLRALTPLIYTHVNPYGTFRLNMSERLPLEEGVIA